MPNIGALWAEMRGGGVGGVQAVFVAKIKKYQGTFCVGVVVGWVPGLKIPNFQKVPP